MKLTPEETVALERLREIRKSGIPVEFSSNLNCVRTFFDALLMACAVLRHCPVRKIGDKYIRWDDEITPERLIASGWKKGSVSVGCAGMQLYPLDGRWWSNGCLVPEMMKPQNMGDIWTLMERAGVPIPGEVL